MEAHRLALHDGRRHFNASGHALWTLCCTQTRVSWQAQRIPPPMDFPLRVIVALVVIGAFAGVGVWGVVAGLQAKRLTNAQRMIGIGGVVVIMALLTASVFFVWPAYWD